MLRLREWPAIQERWAPICMVVTIKWHYILTQMQVEICQSTSIHSTSSPYDAKPGLRRKRLLKKKKKPTKHATPHQAYTTFTEHLTFWKAFHGSYCEHPAPGGIIHESTMLKASGSQGGNRSRGLNSEGSGQEGKVASPKRTFFFPTLGSRAGQLPPRRSRPHTGAPALP